MSDLASNVAAAMAATPAAPAAPTATAPVESAPVVEKAPEPTAVQKEKWKIKADGEEFEWDPSDIEATKRELSKARGANKRFEEAAKMRKQAETFFDMLKNPATLKQVLTDPKVGVDLRKFAEEFVWEQIQEEKLTPEQKRQREVERELQKYREAEAKQKAEAETAQAEALRKHYEADFESKILSALQTGGIPNTRGAVRRMAYYLQQAIANNIDIQPTDLVARVRQDLAEEHRDMYSAADPSSLISLLGEDLAKKLRAADVKRLKSTQPEQYRKQPSTETSKRQGEKTPKRKTMDQFREELQSKLGK